MVDYKKIAKESKASQDPAELEWLLDRVGSVGPKVILEIGVHQGYSCQVWKKAFNPDTLVGIETDIDYIKFQDFVLIEGDSHSPQTYKAAEKIVRSGVDFLFIDGDHTYGGVKADFEMYKHLVREGGIIAFHDAGLETHPDVAVYQFWNQVREKYTNAFFMGKGTGVGVLYV